MTKPPLILQYSRCCLAKFELHGTPPEHRKVCAQCGREAVAVKLEPEARRVKQLLTSQANIATALGACVQAVEPLREHDFPKAQQLARLIYRLNQFTRPEWQAVFALKPEAAQ
jgi:hypothetical protein